MTLWQRLALALIAAPACAAFAQTAEDGVVLSPGLVVNGEGVSAGAGGVSRVDPADLPDAQAGTLADLGEAAANVHVAGSGAGGFGTLLSMRGLANTPYFSDPAVTVYLGDIPMPGGFADPFGIPGLGEVSVYRGPRGTEFGRATDGGVLVFDSGASGGPAGGEVTGGIGSFGDRRLESSAHTASSGDWDAEASAAYDDRAGIIRNTQLGIGVDGVEEEGGFARLRMRPAGGAEVTLEVFDSRARDGAQPLVPLGGPLFDVARQMEGETDVDAWGLALKASFAATPLGTLTAVTSCTDWRMNPYRDFLVLPPPLESEVIQDQKRWNEEIRLATGERAGLAATLGAWLSRGTTDNAVDRSIPGLYTVEDSGFEERDQSGALFGEAVCALGPDWKVVAGVRAEADDKDFDRHEEAPSPGLDYLGSGRYAAVLPRLAARLDLGPAGHGEASLSSGMREGGFSSYTDNPALIPFAPERTTEAAIGWEASALRGALVLTVRAFYDRIDNLQIERSFTATDYFVADAPRAHAAGGELESRWKGGRAWSAGASFGWTGVRLDQFRAPFTGLDESGGSVPGVPRFNSAFDVSYRPLAGWRATARISAVGKTFYDELETPRYTQPTYAEADLLAGYATAGWDVTIFCRNLANRGFYQLIIPGVNSGSPGAPRTLGTAVTLNF